ncbi:MAG TPA: hypothetical protein ENF36_08095 [Desulfobacteraceae bacterium]|nr:hypothetical protein [Desulfobacteraceae bacterium]
MKKWVPEVPNTLGEDRGEIRLISSECPLCKRIFFPAVKICPDCLDDSQPMKKKILNNNGKIFSFSIAQVAPPGYEVPHVQAYIDLPERVRLFTLLVKYGDGSKLKKGLFAKLVIVMIGEDKEGREHLGYRFRPIFEED